MTQYSACWIWIRTGTITCVTVVLLTLALHISIVTAIDGTSWTLLEQGVSYLYFEPKLITKQNQGWHLSFRTIQPNGLLFYHSLKRFNRRKFSPLHEYNLYAELRQGRLFIEHNVNQMKKELNYGIALNDDNWHELDIRLDGKTGHLTISLDNISETNRLRSYVFNDASDILVWSDIDSLVSFGGTKDPIAFSYETFIGCFRDLRYLNDLAIYDDVTIESSRGIETGCKNLCTDGSSRQCENHGECINKYTHTHCDCYGTLYEGEQCQIQGSSSITLRGYEWLIHRLYSSEEQRYSSKHNRFSMQFKTQRSSGILLYAVGTNPTHNHVVVTLYQSMVHISLSFGQKDVEVTMGLRVDNDRWHSLLMEHDLTAVLVELDGVRRNLKLPEPFIYLNLDANIYIGGGDDFVLTRGLKVTQNYVGCLREVYINDISVIYELKQQNEHTHYYGPGEIMHCKQIRDVPITFPRSGSMLLLDSTIYTTLQVELEFRTYQKHATLVYVELKLNRPRGYDYGYLEVWMNDGAVQLRFAPNSRVTKQHEDLIMEGDYSKGMWHKLKVVFADSQVWLQLDADQKISDRFYRKLYRKGKLQIGFSLRRHRSGFVGCMKNLKVQNQRIDPMSIIHSSAAIGVRLDGCPLVDKCKTNDPCEHGSMCVSDWDGAYCDCTNVEYEGHACHFPKHLQSCDDYYQSGWHSSGVYKIDTDGAGPQPPAFTMCTMGMVKDGSKFGMTEVEHNLLPNTTARSADIPAHRKVITYRGMSRWQLHALSESSYQCEQYVKYECLNAPLRLGELTWFKAASGDVVEYIGTSPDPGYCSCHGNQSCADNGACNCDASESKWLVDEGLNKVKQQLPISEMIFNRHPGGQGQITLGKLKCWGQKYRGKDKGITLKTKASYIPLPSWRDGNLEFIFKTNQKFGTILYQSHGPDSTRHFSIRITSARTVEFELGSYGETRHISLKCKQPVTNGEWHRVLVEFDMYNARFTLDKSQKLISLDPDEKVSDYAGDLYLGIELQNGKLHEDSGFIGCIRGFVYNYQLSPLIKHVNLALGLEAGCQAFCQSAPCENGGRCVEKWEGYRCQCQNKWSHLGDRCQINIDTDMVTINGSQSHLYHSVTDNLSLFMKTLVLSFRTYQRDAQLFYIHDQFNNFLQLELRNAWEIAIIFNSMHTIIQDVIRPGPLNDGQWKQVILDMESQGPVRLFVDKSQKFIRTNRKLLRAYSLRPFRSTEIVLPIRGRNVPPEALHIYMGGVPEDMSTPLTQAPLEGCMRGIRLGDSILSLEQASRGATGASVGCASGCDKEGCQNGGICLDHWYGEYACDCSESFYSGPTCQTEPSGAFDGSSVVKYRVVVPSPRLQSTWSEKLTFYFQVSKEMARHNMPSLMVLVYSKSTGDFIRVYLTKLGDVMLETRLYAATYPIKITGNFASGHNHLLQYQRQKHKLMLKVDTKEASMLLPEDTFDDVDTIMVGGHVLDDPLFEQFANFTGCISDVIFYPEDTPVVQFTPLKSLYASPEDPDIQVLSASEVHPCTPIPPVIEKIITPEFYRTTIMNIERVTMTLPPWDVQPVDTLPFGPTTRHPTTHNPNVTAIFPVITRGQIGAITIIIAVALMAAFMVISILIALCLLRIRKKKDEYKMYNDPGSYVELKYPLTYQAKLSEYQAYQPRIKRIVYLASPELSSLTSSADDTAVKRVQPIAVSSDEHSQQSIDDEHFLNPPLAKKKHRPASSISEVLEEMERRRKAKEMGIDLDNLSLDNMENLSRDHDPPDPEDLEWDPVIDSTPLSEAPPEFAPLLPHDKSPTSTTSDKATTLGSNSSERSEKSGGHSSDLFIPVHNGDSGYVAELHPQYTNLPTPSADIYKMYSSIMSDYSTDHYEDPLQISTNTRQTQSSGIGELETEL